MSATEPLNTEVIAVSGGELRRIAQDLAELTRGGLSEGDGERCRALLHEAWGAAALCQLHGLRLLFEESAAILRKAAEADLDPARAATALGDVLPLVPRLLDWMVRTGRDNPCLLIPEITALRTLQGKPPVYEYQVLPDIDWPPFPISGASLADRISEADFRRVLHLYQLGLVGVLRNQNRDKSFDILSRCAGRLADLSVCDAERDYWVLYQLVLGSFAQGGLALRPDRLRLLAAVEKQLRSLAGIRAGKAGNPYPEGLWRAFLALLAMSAAARGGAAPDWLPLPALGFGDEELERTRVEVFDRGETAEPDAFEELGARAVRLRNVLDASQDGQMLAESVLREMWMDCQQIAERTQKLGLDNIARRFREHTETLSEHPGGPQCLTAAQSGAYADSVLYLECALAEFSGEGRPSPEALAAWGQRPLDAVLSGGLASAARNSVLQESGAVLREAKTRIAVLQDGIISDESWRDIDAGFLLLEGAAQMLALEGLAQLLQRAREFVQTSRYHPELGLNDRSRNLDLFADMVISLEVYLDSLRLGRDQQEDSLRIARECAAALRF